MHCCNFKLYIKKFNTKQQGFFPSAKFSLISKFLNGVHDVAWVKNASITRIHFVPSNPLIFPYCVPSRQTGVSAKIYPASAQMHNKQTHQHNATMAFPYTYKKQHTHTRPALTRIPTRTYSRRASAVHVKPQVHNHEYLTDCCRHTLHICHPPPPLVDGLLSNGNIIIQGDFPCQCWDGIYGYMCVRGCVHLHPRLCKSEYFSDNVRKSFCACMSAWMSQEYRAEHTKGEQGIACVHVCGLSWSFVRNLGQGRRPSEEEDIGLSPWTVSGQTGSKTHYAPLWNNRNVLLIDFRRR